MPTRIAALVILTLGLSTACGDNDPYYGGLGAPCNDDRDCRSGSNCEHRKEGGDCTYSCRYDEDCGPGSACVDAHGGSCHVLCNSDRDCAYGFDCKKKKNEGRGGDSHVCEP